MKTEQIKIDQDLSQAVWKRGIRRPPRKIRVKMAKTDEGYVLVSTYEEDVKASEEKPKDRKAKKQPEPKAEAAKIEPKIEEPKEKPEPKKAETKPEEPKKEAKKEVKPKKTEVKKSKGKKPAKKSK